MENAPFKVVIVGSGPTEQQLKKQAQDLGLANVEFAGHVTDEVKVALIQLSSAIVFPSYLRSEAFGVTLLEGAMFGKALISTEVGSGTTRVNMREATGLVVPPASPRALRKALDALHNEPEKTALLGQQAKTRFEQLFTGDLMAQRYWKLYNELL